MKSWFAVKNLVALAAAAIVAGAVAAPPEISVYDEIGLWGVTGADYMDAFSALPGDSVILNINSPGGSVFDALLMYNGMKASGKNITVRIMGVAASAASLIAMAGTTIEMPENTFMMLHRPMTGAYGNEDELRSAADMVGTIGKSLQATYEKRSGQTPEAMAAILSKDTWLSAQECVDKGLADKVTPAVEATAKFELDRQGIPANVMAVLTPKVAVLAPAAQAKLAFADQVKAQATAAGLGDYSAVFALDPAITTAEALATAIADAREIVALCTVVGSPDAAKAAINARQPIAALRTELIAAKTVADRATAISSAPPIGAAAKQGRERGGQQEATSFGPNSYWNPVKTAA